MKLAAVPQFVARRTRYLALALPVFALFSTIQAGCSSSAKGGYYGYGSSSSSSSGGSSGARPPPDCPVYTVYTGYGGYESYSNCDDPGGYGSP